MIQSSDYMRLSTDVIEIIKATSKSPHIRKISFASVDEPSRKKNFTLKQSVTFSLKALKALIRRIAFLIDKFDCFINKYDLSKRKLSSLEIQSFCKKSNDVFLTKQFRKSFYSYTSFVDSEGAKKQDFDLLLRVSGLCIEKGEILNSYSRLGVLSLHHGNNILNRGGPVGFWEVFWGEESGITAQILTPELDGGKVVSRGRIRTIPNPTANSANIIRHTSAVLQAAFAIIASKSFFTNSSNHKFIQELEVCSRNIFKEPSVILRFFISSKTLFNSLFALLFIRIPRYIYAKYRNPYEKWGISLTKNYNKRLGSWTRIYPLNCKPGSDDWVADPFFINLGGIDYLLFEYYSWSKRKGSIGYSRINHFYSEDKSDLQISSSGILLENEYHLSYPYAFNVRNESFFIPENNVNGANLYRIRKTDENVLTSVMVKNLLKGYCIDPTYVRLKGFDYLFLTHLGETGNTLHLFFCKDITKDELIMHPSSPLCVDHSLGRSAGRIFIESEDENIIIRPSQIMKESYGRGILLSRYKVDEGECRLLGVQKKIKPPRGSLYSHIHHIDHLNGITAIDYK